MSECADTWWNRQLVAKYGKAFRYPLCRAAFSVWQTRNLMRQVEQAIEAAEQNRHKAALLIRRLREAGKPKEAKQVGAILFRISDVLRKARRSRHRERKGIQALRESLAWLEAGFAHESISALQARDFAAFTALQRAWKAWKSFDKPVDHRTLVILDALRTEALAEAKNKGGITERWLEAAVGAKRTLSDRAWPKLTARDLHNELVTAKSFLRDGSCLEGQLRQVRRLANKIGIRLQQVKRAGRPKGSRNWRTGR